MSTNLALAEARAAQYQTSQAVELAIINKRLKPNSKAAHAYRKKQTAVASPASPVAGAAQPAQFENLTGGVANPPEFSAPEQNFDTFSGDLKPGETQPPSIAKPLGFRNPPTRREPKGIIADFFDFWRGFFRSMVRN